MMDEASGQEPCPTPLDEEPAKPGSIDTKEARAIAKDAATATEEPP